MSAGVNFAVVLLIFSLAATYTILYPITLPVPMLTPAVNMISSWWMWNSIFPIQEIYNAFIWDIALLFVLMMFKLFIGFLSLILGAGKPDLD